MNQYEIRSQKTSDPDRIYYLYFKKLVADSARGIKIDAEALKSLELITK